MGLSLLGRRGVRRAGSIGVALVGREQPGSENLSLRYLARALDDAGHRPIIVPLSGPHSLPEAASHILSRSPALVGLSMPDSDATIDALAFVHYLRERGFRGHVTCGGPVATLVRGELLDAHAGIDSVIRHDGEIPLTELAGRLATNADWSDVAGITTRRGDGPPSPVADPLPLSIRPLHADPLPALLGVPTARLSASRGCPGRCPYCAPAALQREAVREGRALGLSRDALSQAGVGKTRYRHALDLADEVAELYHGQGARFFQLVDENLLSGGAERAETWLVDLIQELERRGVPRTAWCLQADPETLTPRVLDLLEQLGVIRISVGVEGLTTSQLRSLGRGADTTENQRLLAHLAARGFVTTFNSIIVHSRSTREGIARELDALERLPPLHFDVLSMAVYPGTQAHKALVREGRVTGGILATRFEPHDPVVSRFRAGLIRIRLQALGRYGTNIFAHDVAVNVALARRLDLPCFDPAFDRDLPRILETMNAARLRAYRAALALAHAEIASRDRETAMVALLGTLERDLEPVRRRLVRMQARLEGSVDGKIRSSNLMIASAMAAGFALTVATACGGQVAPDDHDSSRGGTGTADTGGAGGRPQTGGTPSVEPGSGGTFASGGAGPEPCDEWQIREQLADCTTCDSHQFRPYGVVLNAEGRAIDVVSDTGAPVPEDVRRCYLAALAGQTFPCLSGETVWYECVALLL